MKRLTHSLLTIALCIGLSGCADMSRRDAGLVAGGAVGGAAGYALTGSALGTAAGAVGGAYVGTKLAE